MEDMERQLYSKLDETNQLLHRLVQVQEDVQARQKKMFTIYKWAVSVSFVLIGAWFLLFIL